MQLCRRQLLRLTAGVGTLALLSGCQALSGDGSGGETTTPTGTTTPGGTRDADTLRRRTREFLDLLDAGEFDTAHERLAEPVQIQVSPAEFSQLWAHLEAALGPYTGVGEFDHDTSGGVAVLEVAARFERGSRRFEFAYQDGSLVRVRLLPPETGDWEPPGYADRSTFAEHDREIVATEDCALGATLTLPAGEESVPGVVLVHGNGEQDRDETIGPNKPFKDLAWGLATRGIAVLRYDKRTHACEVDLANATVDDVVTDDALAAVDLLRAEHRVADGDVVVAGHSFGATLAPRIATRDGNLAGVAMLAPLARPMPETIVDQRRYIFELDGQLSDSEERQLERTRSLAEKIRRLDVSDEEVVLFGGREYWQTYRNYEKFATARALDAPVSLYFGGRDWQVTEEDARLWREELGAGPTIRTYDDLNHFFVAHDPPPTSQEYLQPANVAERVVTDLASWIRDVVGEAP